MTKRYVSLIAAILLVSLFAFCAAEAAPLPFSEDPAAITDASNSVVMLYCFDSTGEVYGTGSGFAAFEDGIIVTNYHVVDENVCQVTAKTERKTFFDIDDILAVDAENDIAILQTSEHTGLTILPFGSNRDLLKGSKVVAIGSPKGMINSVSSGMYSGVVEVDGIELVQFDAAISHGSSGGALFNNSGEVIGITSSGLEDANSLNFAVPIEKVTELWQKYLADPVGSRSPDAALTAHSADGNAQIMTEEDAQALADEGRYREAAAAFERLGRHETALDCRYQEAVSLFEDAEYEQTCSVLESLAKEDYEDSAEFLNDVRLIFVMSEIAGEGDAVKIANTLRLLEKEAGNDLSEAYESFYYYGQKCYEKGDYDSARTAFSSVKNDRAFADRAAAYEVACRCMENGDVSESDYSKLASYWELIHPEEAVQCSSDAMWLFLEGSWRASNGMMLSVDDSGLSDNMPSPVSGPCSCCFDGNNLLVCTEDSRQDMKKNKEFTVIDMNTIEVYCYADSSTYTLYRR